ncbi:Flavin-dependent oxidoreductase, luciferase family (includes alkanesulfonate monooxygenase SsuD and methylene tetrahydromethanopterin reductase) [Microlunatus sagamiharensis]|uniref:Flavin-dependent oxidoreductase, luciferase family (Includes alkanesulfonate monooxygenase SsuD and methylene tetrahydromethanopterin reductase) n=1 Tax=Microlunatus sagamiharensis TaxID=546874 RepID=A0A1H2MHG4_9ACTN|nr:LLM class flavin-dependent oxidoreductase [Microlunatus sagamiharensis]SDU92687.1 Flavin-dependent oxidoreductase, luciferase family (includes alkanesulfonate monooxygenase SsuD and methylene tetrahydromethanopterin reductase) [Microlunatus sagamiharensis]
MTRPLHLAVALDGAGWHPTAWRLPTARPRELLTAGYWVDLARRAEEGLLDLVTFEDGLSLQSTSRTGPDHRTDEVRGRLDAVLVAARVAPVTSRVGLVPTTTVTHTEPFHVSKAIATLDVVSQGRGGWRPQVSARPDEVAHFGRREAWGDLLGDPDDVATQALVRDLFEEAGEAVEVVRRLWDSWEDDAEIRDVATGRFVDRDKLHYVDFSGRSFSVRGPSITPRPPQGQPVVVALAHAEVPRTFAARSADVVLITPHDNATATAQVEEIVAGRREAGREGTDHVFGDLVVLLDDDQGGADARWAQLEAWAGRPYTSDAEVFVGTPQGLADLLLARAESGLTGFRLRPAALPQDLDAIVDGLVPELQRRGAFRTAYDDGTLRDRLGLERPANRYATTGAH